MLSECFDPEPEPWDQKRDIFLIFPGAKINSRDHQSASFADIIYMFPHGGAEPRGYLPFFTGQQQTSFHNSYLPGFTYH